MPTSHFKKNRLHGHTSSPFPGISKVSFGKPDKFTPGRFRAEEPSPELKKMEKGPHLPFDPEQIICQLIGGRLSLCIPCDEPEDEIFGFGLDSGTVKQKGLRKILGVSARNVTKTGMSHGPIPFYVSTKGYGVWVDTARVPTIHVARLDLKKSTVTPVNNKNGSPATSEAELYAAQSVTGKQYVIFEIAGAEGIDLFLFNGPTMLDAVKRYNLFSGGGAMPALWGLGLKYRNYTGSDQKAVLDVAANIRKNNIPCDVIGLEPGWHTQAYSSSFVWSKERFPEPDQLISDLKSKGYQINLWEHAYVHPTSPLYKELEEKSGNFLVWKGLVIDFGDEKASKIFSEYHKRNFLDKGIIGFKADECDNQPPQDCTPFNFPYASEFPSGISGEEMVQLYGYLYQRSLYKEMKSANIRTFSDVRATSSLCSPLPFALYSDTYTPIEYLRQLVNSSFTGLLWSPEIRNADSEGELFKRIGMAVFAQHFCLNPWYIPNPIWMQFDAEKNKNNELMDQMSIERVVSKIRNLVEWRMSLVPYLYSSFYKYHVTGVPPVRALVLDFPDDPKVRDIDDSYIFGESLLVTPVLDETDSRKVYLPAGTNWYDFHSGEIFMGGTEVKGLEKEGLPPLFVKENSLIPMATPLQHVEEKSIFELTVKVFGKDPKPFVLFEDDGVTYGYEKNKFNLVELSWVNGKGKVTLQGDFPGERYVVKEFNTIG